MVTIVELILKSKLTQSPTPTLSSVGDRVSGVGPMATTNILLDGHTSDVSKIV